MNPPARTPEKVILVGVGLKSEGALLASSLLELRRLTETAGGQVIGETSQRLERYRPGTLIGEGKIREISESVRGMRAQTVIFDLELAPAQQKTLERAIPAKVLDRTRLILDIFAKRARTSEGRLQVELAQLSYMLPRLTGSWRNFSQQVGGIGTRGPGESKLEYERRHIQSRIQRLKDALKGVQQDRFARRRKRLSVPVPQVALIGYTNVGKSTILNLITRHRANLYADDKLFATLDSTARRVRLPEGLQTVFTDTVGFIQRLPTSLVAAFRSTLEEVSLADLLLIVSDASSANREAQDNTVLEVLAELGAMDVPRITVFNKADKCSEELRRLLLRSHPEAILLSARTGEGIPLALARVQEALSRRWLLRELDIPLQEGKLKSEIYRAGQVLSEQVSRNCCRLRLRVTLENWNRILKLAGRG